ncbi:DNA polymerase [Bacillaceae bacterium Marseille-Q3522]|nr:DNA polymerase [Bacillaceae bacterium Marseille-Q3522]
MNLSIDIETFSSVNIMKSGLYKYVQSPDFEILLFAYSVNDLPVKIIDLAQGEKIPNSITEMMGSPSVIKHAYNAPFEHYCLSKYFNWHPMSWLHQWRDTMLHGLYCGYTTGLGKTAEALGLPEDKQKDRIGKSLINLFSKPVKPTKRNGNRTRTLPHHEPEKWQLFKDYCMQDVEVEKAIDKKLVNFPVPDEVERQWQLDQQINMYGVGLDRALIEGALHLDELVKSTLTLEAHSITKLSNPNSTQQLTGWLINKGVNVANLQKDTVADLVKNTEGDVKRVLEIRQQLSKTSIKKYKAMEETICDDNRGRGFLQFYGANRTGREAGRFVQVQNLTKNHIETLDLARDLVKRKKISTLQMLYGDVADLLSQLVRTAFIPSPGHKIAVADFSAIEARVIAWLSKEQWRLDVFNTHGKIYEASASQMFGVPIEKIKKGDPLRQQGKVAELALGYAGGVGAMKRMDFGGDIRPADMSDEAVKNFARQNSLDLVDEFDFEYVREKMIDTNYMEIVRRWRASSKNIVNLWYSFENAVLSVMRDGRPVGVNGVLFARESDIQNGLDFLTIQLPSRRKLYYVKPFIAENDFGKEALCYYGMDQTTKKWEKQNTYGGKLVENVVQAIARDCLFVAMERLTAAGYQIVMTIHDEVVLDVPAERADIDKIVEIMTQPISWAPGLPLNADGFVSDYYKKD